jgi:hypothetical protein
MIHPSTAIVIVAWSLVSTVLANYLWAWRTDREWGQAHERSAFQAVLAFVIIWGLWMAREEELL